MKLSTLGLILRIMVSLVTWLAMMALRLFFVLLGYPLIWWQSRYVVVDTTVNLQFRAWWMWLYGNREDGIDGRRGGDAAQQWWMDRTRGMTLLKRVFAWSAVRNPVNNLRYVPILAPKFRPESIAFLGTGDEPPDGQSGWAYTWQGLYSGFYYKTPRLWFWIGWKFRPSDRNGVPPTDTRLPRCDFATQLQRVRKS